jgi:hypothetical protein
MGLCGAFGLSSSTTMAGSRTLFTPPATGPRGAGLWAEKVELMTGIDGASRPVRKVVLRAKQQARPLGMAQGGMASEKYRAAN